MNEDLTFDRNAVLSYLSDRFGLDSALFDDYNFYATEKGKVFLGPRRSISRADKIVSIGLLCFRIDNAIKPTTNLLQIVGNSITKNRLELDQKNAEKYLLGNDLILDKSFLSNVSDGYILMTYKDHSLGCGLLRGTVIKNQLPKAKRLDVKYW